MANLQEHQSPETGSVLYFFCAFAMAAVVFLILVCSPTHAADFRTKERIKTYSITGTTGRALYVSIGQNGPKIGRTRTIAHTTFDLKWRRNYKPRTVNGTKGCKLVSAKPFFTVIYTVPKAKTKLPAAVSAKWKTFYQGILTHEKVHGTHAREMVSQIIRETVGLSVASDPNCKKIRAEVLKRVKQAYADYKAKGRTFDRAELGASGTVRQLAGELVQ